MDTVEAVLSFCLRISIAFALLASILALCSAVKVMLLESFIYTNITGVTITNGLTTINLKISKRN